MDTWVQGPLLNFSSVYLLKQCHVCGLGLSMAEMIPCKSKLSQRKALQTIEKTNKNRKNVRPLAKTIAKPSRKPKKTKKPKTLATMSKKPRRVGIVANVLVFFGISWFSRWFCYGCRQWS